MSAIANLQPAVRRGLGARGRYLISVVRDRRDQQVVEALCREVFERELGLDYGRLADTLDASLLVLLGRHRGRAVASVRVAVRSEGPFEDEAELMLDSWRGCGFADAELALCSRLFALPEHRKSGVVAQMLQVAYAAAQQLGVRLCFVDVPVALVPYYLGLGFRVFRSSYLHPELGGRYMPLVIFIGDREHFRAVGSYFAALSERDDAGRARAALARGFGLSRAGPARSPR